LIRRVILHHQFGGLGGIETFFINLAVALKNTDKSVIMISPKDGYIQKACDRLGIEHIEDINVSPPFKRNLGPSFYSKEEISRLMKIGGKINKDYSKNYGKTVCIAGNPLALIEDSIIHRGISQVFLCNGIFHPRTFVKLGRSLKSIALRNYDSLIRTTTRKDDERISHIIRTLDYYHALWSMSDSCRKYNEVYFALQLKNTPTIPLIYDVNVEKNQILDNTKRKISALWIGRFTYFKVNELLAVYDSLLKVSTRANVMINMHIVGSGKRKYSKVLRKIIRSTERVSVIFHGLVNHDSLSQIVSTADIGVGMGLSTLETASAGIATVVVPGGHKNWQDVNGVLFSDSNFDLGEQHYLEQVYGEKNISLRPLDELFFELLEERIRKEEGARSRKAILENLSPKIILDRMINYLDQVELTPEIFTEETSELLANKNLSRERMRDFA